MRLFRFALTLALALGSLPALAHGPQIQITRDSSGEIITRRIVSPAETTGHYPTELTNQTSVYVMPLTQYLEVWRAQPDNSKLPNGDPEFVGWPGFTYGHGYDALLNPQPFPTGSRFILGFTDGLKAWDGSSMFVDAGTTQLEAYRGPSNAPSALAKTSDIGPFQSLMLPGAAGISFAAEGADTHNTVNYRMLGNGSSITSPLADGIYLVSMRLSSTASSLVTPSDPYYFVLHKGADPAMVAAAIDSLGFSGDAVQVIPEPGAFMLGFAGCICIWGCNGSLRRRNRQ